MKYHRIPGTRRVIPLQDRQFAFHRASRQRVLVHLTNGTSLAGTVVGADTYMLLLQLTEEDPAPQLVYKHAIAAISIGAPLPATPGMADDKALDGARRLFAPRTRRRR